MTQAETYRGEGHQRQPGCSLPAHYTQIQAICDALMHAAQLEMAEAASQLEDLQRLIVGRRVIGVRFAREIARADHQVGVAYGKWLGIKGVLRGAELATYDFTETEKSMFERIDWERETFVFPGKEAFPSLDQQHLPGEGTDG